jgi:hypothetical protein
MKSFTDLYISKHLIRLEIVKQLLSELGVLLSTLSHDCTQSQLLPTLELRLRSSLFEVCSSPIGWCPVRVCFPTALEPSVLRSSVLPW